MKTMMLLAAVAAALFYTAAMPDRSTASESMTAEQANLFQLLQAMFHAQNMSLICDPRVRDGVMDCVAAREGFTVKVQCDLNKHTCDVPSGSAVTTDE